MGADTSLLDHHVRVFSAASPDYAIDEGRVVALIDDPSMLIERDDGSRTVYSRTLRCEVLDETASQAIKRAREAREAGTIARPDLGAATGDEAPTPKTRQQMAVVRGVLIFDGAMRAGDLPAALAAARWLRELGVGGDVEQSS